MNALLIGIDLQVKNLLRVKKALFFSFIFPLFLFVLFAAVMGNGSEYYAKFLLTGIIVITVASDALFSIGKVIATYYLSGEIRFYKTLPYGFYKVLLAIIVSRLLVLLAAIALLLLIAWIFFKVPFTVTEVVNYGLAIVGGTLLFSLIGLALASITKENASDSGLVNLVFYGMMFLSDTFYEFSSLSPVTAFVAKVNPFTPVLSFARGTPDYLSLGIWILVMAVIVLASYRNIKLDR